jgi:probable F420-dependent oxidoreductase
MAEKGREAMADSAGLRERLGRFGIFAGPPARLGIDPVVLAAAIEQAGFTSAWIGGGNATPSDLDALGKMLEATERLVVAPGIVNIWAWQSAALRAAASALAWHYPGRFILGLGVSHHPVVEGLGQAYERPLSKMVSFLDELGQGTDDDLPPVVLAALGPKMLALAGERTAGAHPYFTTAEHTARARSILGAGPLLVPEIAGSLAAGAAGAAAVRRFARRYLQLPNYVNNLLASGFTADDIAEGGSDALLAAVTPHGTERFVAGIRSHLAAGADHVVIQPLAEDGGFALADLETLAAAVAVRP